MEHASALSELPLPKDLRPKQIEVIEAFKTRTRVIAKLPTGYGKTLAAAGGFAQLRHRGVCNRMLCIVPRRNQANQIAEDMPEDLARFDIKTKAINVGKHPIQAINAHKNNSILVYVCTVQSLLTDGGWKTITSLMETGRWMVFVDEHHHYSADNEGDSLWTSKIKDLSYAAILAMSATAKRHDRADYFGEPEIVETYRDAANASYVKKLWLHAYHYTLDAIMIDGKVVQYTTEELAAEAGSDSPEAIEKYMASRKMRFSPKYISPLVMFPVDRLIDLRTIGIRSQLIILAMSCSHAKCVTEQISNLVPENIKVDWVGTGPSGRTDEENDGVIKQFCPPKNKATGKRPWTLDVLVNVGMAGEGLDCIDDTEIVFLTPANNTISNKQAIGRGARIMKLAEGQVQPACHINVDTGSDLGKYLKDAIMDVFDDGVRKPEDRKPPERDPSDYQELPEKLGWVIADVRLVDIRGQPMFKELYKQLRAATDPCRSDEECADFVERGIMNYFSRTNNQSSILAQKTDQIDAACSKIAGLVLRRISEAGIRVERTLAGDIRRRINSRKKGELGSVQGADDEMLERHWEWVKQLERRILLDHGLNGVPQWLR